MNQLTKNKTVRMVNTIVMNKRIGVGSIVIELNTDAGKAKNDFMLSKKDENIANGLGVISTPNITIIFCPDVEFFNDEMDVSVSVNALADEF